MLPLPAAKDDWFVSTVTNMKKESKIPLNFNPEKNEASIIMMIPIQEFVQRFQSKG
jgi:hypothetical protein